MDRQIWAEVLLVLSDMEEGDVKQLVLYPDSLYVESRLTRTDKIVTSLPEESISDNSWV